LGGENCRYQNKGTRSKTAEREESQAQGKGRRLSSSHPLEGGKSLPTAYNVRKELQERGRRKVRLRESLGQKLSTLLKRPHEMVGKRKTFLEEAEGGEHHVFGPGRD